MKNLFLGLILLAGTSTFANNSIASKHKTLKANSKKEVKIKGCCTVFGGGVTVTACGGDYPCMAAINALHCLQ